MNRKQPTVASTSEPSLLRRVTLSSIFPQRMPTHDCLLLGHSLKSSHPPSLFSCHLHLPSLGPFPQIPKVGPFLNCNQAETNRPKTVMGTVPKTMPNITVSNGAAMLTLEPSSFLGIGFRWTTGKNGEWFLFVIFSLRSTNLHNYFSMLFTSVIFDSNLPCFHFFSSPSLSSACRTLFLFNSTHPRPNPPPLLRQLNGLCCRRRQRCGGTRRAAQLGRPALPGVAQQRSRLLPVAGRCGEGMVCQVYSSCLLGIFVGRSVWVLHICAVDTRCTVPLRDCHEVGFQWGFLMFGGRRGGASPTCAGTGGGLLQYSKPVVLLAKLQKSRPKPAQAPECCGGHVPC